eukprot:3399043-Pleurochrysis_carterae.AAC.3
MYSDDDHVDGGDARGISTPRLHPTLTTACSETSACYRNGSRRLAVVAMASHSAGSSAAKVRSLDRSAQKPAESSLVRLALKT